MATLKQIEANRRNSQHSTGPRSAAGKSRSSRNAVTHGGYSTRLLTPDEKAADLVGLETVYLLHYDPQSALDHDQVIILAGLDWRLRRCGRMETEILTVHGFERTIDYSPEFNYEGAGWGLTHDCTKAKSVLALSLVEERIARRFRLLKKELDSKLMVNKPSLPAPEPPRRKECP